MAYCFAASLVLASDLSHAQNAKHAREPKLQMVYSADADLCTSANRAFRSIHRRYPRAFYIANVPKAFFSTPRFGKPHWLPDSDSAVVDLGISDSRFLRLNFADGQRLIGVGDDPLGSHGDFTTDVWISKPGKDLAVRTEVDKDVGEITTPDPADVELLITFEQDDGQPPSRYPLATLAKKTLLFAKEPLANSDAIKSINLFFVEGHAQEAFEFKNKLYFLAGSAFSGPWVIYGFDKNAAPTMECIADFL